MSGSSGVWRSLAARPLWERKAPGSSGTPTRRRRPGSSAAATMRVGADWCVFPHPSGDSPSERRRDPQPDPGSARGRGVPFEGLEPSIKSAYQRIAAQVNVPGFRRGKGAAAGHRPAHRAASSPGRGRQRGAPALRPGRRGQRAAPLGQPEVDVTDFADGQELKFTVEVDIRPSVTLPDWEGLWSRWPTPT